jgi:opacity protein-like surface antigen
MRLNLFFLAFLLSILCLSNKSMAFEERFFPYFQYNLLMNVYSAAYGSYSTSTSEGTTTSEVSTSLGVGDVFYSSNFLIGFHFANGYSVELDYNALDIFMYNIGSRIASVDDQSETVFRADYFFTNVKKDFYDLKDFTMFVKLGLGVAQISQPFKISAPNASNDLEFAYQLSFGTFYRMSKNFDLELGYKYMGNISDKEFVSSYQSSVSVNLQNHLLYLGTRYKL